MRASEPPPLRLQAGERDGSALLEVGGTVDYDTAPQLREALLGIIDSGRRQVVVDLAGVEFMDSTGLGVLVLALKRLRDAQGQLRLTGAQVRPMKLFETTGLVQIFDLSPAVQEDGRP